MNCISFSQNFVLERRKKLLSVEFNIKIFQFDDNACSKNGYLRRYTEDSWLKFFIFDYQTFWLSNDHQINQTTIQRQHHIIIPHFSYHLSLLEGQLQQESVPSKIFQTRAI